MENLSVGQGGEEEEEGTCFLFSFLDRRAMTQASKHKAARRCRLRCVAFPALCAHVHIRAEKSKKATWSWLRATPILHGAALQQSGVGLCGVGVWRAAFL
ncbi:uncharacterized protein Tco025E_02325 [Trypanosoma conorhini]|uniref:Uncharacterized protein n=1 Tax=Trypanosoma conorhini TaxID=83891 RepID=A0A422Q580_9TRYP|nr:uncharacterized protein Tco025E_02325 [Trypanosoma conorhini]RNF25092.1 hypothetical protein Tco025E_02325 [Trypanosoma conorhini]